MVWHKYFFHFFKISPADERFCHWAVIIVGKYGAGASGVDVHGMLGMVRGRAAGAEQGTDILVKGGGGRGLSPLVEKGK
jgi:hypothetical protein